MEMLAAAARYCAVIERANTDERREFAVATESALALVLAAATQLPAVTSSTVRTPHGPSYGEWRDRFAAVHRTLGDWDFYWTTDSPDDITRSVNLLLSDDLTDVWRILKGGLLAFDRGAAVDDVIGEWRGGFWAHWGYHATEALRVVHARVAYRDGPALAEHGPDGDGADNP